MHGVDDAFGCVPGGDFMLGSLSPGNLIDDEGHVHPGVLLCLKRQCTNIIVLMIADELDCFGSELHE